MKTIRVLVLKDEAHQCLCNAEFHICQKCMRRMLETLPHDPFTAVIFENKTNLGTFVNTVKQLSNKGTKFSYCCSVSMASISRIGFWAAVEIRIT